MFCSNCGSAVQDGARFCSNCGSALAQSAPQPQQQTYQQPTHSYNTEGKKCGVTVVYPDGHNEIGDIVISATEILFLKKSKAIRLSVGFIGSAMEKGQEKLLFPIADIVRGSRTRIGLNGNVYQITMKNGETYKFCFNMPKNISYLEGIIGNR